VLLAVYIPLVEGMYMLLVVYIHLVEGMFAPLTATSPATTLPLTVMVVLASAAKVIHLAEGMPDRAFCARTPPVACSTPGRRACWRRARPSRPPWSSFWPAHRGDAAVHLVGGVHVHLEAMDMLLTGIIMLLVVYICLVEGMYMLLVVYTRGILAAAFMAMTLPLTDTRDTVVIAFAALPLTELTPAPMPTSGPP
jgi:hypothetical protein